MASAEALATEALALVGRDPKQALSCAETALAAAQLAMDHVTISMAHRVAGLALRELGELVAAEARARTAVQVAAVHELTQAEAQARMTLAFLLLERGRVRAALAQADRAPAPPPGLPAARLISQRALLLHRTGRLEEALAAYAAALPTLRRFDDSLWEARLLNNRGLLHVDRGTLTAAESDLRRAGDLYAGLGMDMLAADAERNLGVVAARRGDAAVSLARFDQAEALYQRLGTPRARLLLDRCEVLLSVGLTAEARHTAARAVDLFRMSGQGVDLAEGRLELARAALADGAPEVARNLARVAQAVFTRQDRSAWALLARLIGLRAAEVIDSSAASLRRSAVDCATALAATGWRIAELDARLVAARAALRSGDLPAAREQLGRTAAVRRSGPLELRVRAWYAQALLREADRDRRGTLAALRAGLSLVERQQLTLGATELRVHVASYGTELAGMGLRLAIAAGTATAVLAWAERCRAGTLRLRPVRPPEDPELAAAMAEVRRLSAEQVQASLSGTAAPRAAARRAAEQRVVRASRTVTSPLHRPSGPPPSPAELDAELGDAALVEFIKHDDQLFAVTLRARRCRLHRLGAIAPVLAQLEAAHFALRRLALGFGTARSLGHARTAAAVAATSLQERLLDPLRRDIEDRPLVVVPTGELHATPWGMLPGLAHRTVRICPSASAWLRAARLPLPDPAGRTVLAAGPRLPAAETEVTALARHYPRADVLLGAQACTQLVLAALDGAELAHIAAHGVLRTDNPLFSALELADGPLTVYDLERLAGAPRVVVLPACQSGITAVRSGDELMGLVSALLALGTRTVIATVIPVPDTTTASLMLALHRQLRDGQAPAAALAAVCADSDVSDPAAYATACGFACFGA